LVCGDDADFAEAIKMIDTKFRQKIVEIIRKKALSANEHDLFDIYQEVLISIFECAKKRSYNPDAQKLEGFIYTIAHHRAVDWVRKKTGILEEPNTDKVLEAVNQAIGESKYSSFWEMAQLEKKRELFLANLQKSIPSLKGRQRQVAEIINDDFPKHLEIADIKKQILKRYGEEVTIVSVKRAKQEVLSKIKEALSEFGYGEDVNE
jgi:DNA-directed RNA polymerase specialized sigma24 family protein